jgi:hypothetical protein
MKFILIYFSFVSICFSQVWPFHSGDKGMNDSVYRDSVDTENVKMIKQALDIIGGDIWYYESIRWFPSDSSEQGIIKTDQGFCRWFFLPPSMNTDSLRIYATLYSKHSPLVVTPYVYVKQDIINPKIDISVKQYYLNQHNIKKEIVKNLRIKYKEKATKTKLKYKDSTGNSNKKLTAKEFESLVWKVVNKKAEILE